MENIKNEVLLNCKQCDAKQCQDHQLHWTDFPQQSSISNETSSHTEVSIDDTDESKMENYG